MERLRWRQDGYFEITWGPEGSHLRRKSFRFTYADWLNGFPDGWPKGARKVGRQDLERARRLSAHRMRGHGYSAEIKARAREGAKAKGPDQEALKRAEAIVAEAAWKSSLAKYAEWERWARKAGEKASPALFEAEVEKRKGK